MFITSLLFLSLITLLSFIVAFRNAKKALLIFVPAIALCGSLIYFSYVSALGHAVELSWDQLPKRITVVFFNVSRRLELWIIQGGKGRLVSLPLDEGIKQALEGERDEMAKGTMITIERTGEKGILDGNQQGYYKYRIISKGKNIGEGALPPK